jgi:hypothetical protein
MMPEYRELIIVDNYEKYKNIDMILASDIIISKKRNNIIIHKNKHSYQDAIKYLENYFDLKNINILDMSNYECVDIKNY